MIAYSPFGSPDLPWGEKLPHILIDPVLKSIAEKHSKSTALVCLRWLLQRGLPTIPKVMIFSSDISKKNLNYYGTEYELAFCKSIPKIIYHFILRVLLNVSFWRI